MNIFVKNLAYLALEKESDEQCRRAGFQGVSTLSTPLQESLAEILQRFLSTEVGAACLLEKITVAVQHRVESGSEDRGSWLLFYWQGLCYCWRLQPFRHHRAGREDEQLEARGFGDEGLLATALFKWHSRAQQILKTNQWLPAAPHS